MSCCFFFFFNDAATTGIYTYGHPLSLPDALPIYDHLSGRQQVHRDTAPGHRARPQRRRRQMMVVEIGERHAQLLGIGARQAGAAEHDRDVVAEDILGDARSEEHTSELQSLMRISYAVFCLKKKKLNTHT